LSSGQYSPATRASSSRSISATRAADSAGGALRVLNLDLTRSALEWGKANYRANGFAVDDHDFVYGDVFDWLARLAKRDERFDLVILDPPGFSRTKSRTFSAARDHSDLAGSS
jgi:23S rRNA (cytosine1962-C5)-methyltransferase